MTKDKDSLPFYGIDLLGISYGREKPAWSIELVTCWDKSKLFDDHRIRESSCGSMLGVFTSKEIRQLHDELTKNHEFEEGSLAHDSFVEVDEAINTGDTMFFIVQCYLNM